MPSVGKANVPQIHETTIIQGILKKLHLWMWPGSPPNFFRLASDLIKVFGT